MIKDIEIIDCKNPTSLKEIKKFEQLIDAKLPEDYKNFLLKYNGGHPTYNSYELIESLPDTNSDGINWFRPLGKEYRMNLERDYNVFLNRIPYQMISIADAPCGNRICLGIKEPYYGKVYFWDHNFEAGAIKDLYENFGIEIAMKNTGLSAREIINYGDEPTFKNVYLTANSFTDFIDKLKPYEDE